jgi:hypothetical protein
MRSDVVKIRDTAMRWLELNQLSTRMAVNSEERNACRNVLLAQLRELRFLMAAVDIELQHLEEHSHG